jgi:threonine dehydratase
MYLVEDRLDPLTGEGAGAGTIGLEILRWTELFDLILIALGNGAMLTGIGRCFKAYSPKFFYLFLVYFCYRGGYTKKMWKVFLGVNYLAS